MKNSKKRFSLLLALLMLASSLVACAEDSSEEETTASDPSADTVTEETVAETEPEETEPMVKDNLPEGLNFGGEDVNVLATDYADTNAYEMFTRDELTGEVLNDAIYNRNAQVSERLDIKMNVTESPFGWEDRNLMYDTVRTAVMSGGDEYDLIPCAVYFNSSMIGEGLMTAINDLPYVDLTKPYWFDGFNSTATIDGNTYMAASDATLTYLSVLYCMPFNVNMANDHQITNLYELVDEGKWTLDALKDIVGTMYVDLNGNGTVDLGDQYGLEILDGNYVYSHLTSSEAGALAFIDGEYVYTYGDERTVNLYDKLYDLMFNTDNAVTIQFASRVNGPFGEGESLFTSMMLFEAVNFRDLAFDYSVLPYPKFDENQEEYHTCVGNNATVFMVPVTARGSEKVGAFLEAISSAAYNSTTAAYYEETLQGKYSNSADMARMIELLRETEYMNVGDVFASAIGAPHDMFKGTVMNISKSGAWASTAKGMKKGVEKSLEKFLKNIAELDATNTELNG